MRPTSRIFLATTCLATVQFLAATSAYAQSDGETIVELRQQVQAMEEREAANQAQIHSLEQRLNALETLLNVAGGTHISDQLAATMRGRGAAQGVTAQTYADGTVAVAAAQEGTPTSASAEEEQRKAPAPTDAVEDITQKEQGYFGSRLTFETGVGYSHFDEARLNLSGFLALDAIFLGLINLDQVSADIVTVDATARYGITNRLQIDANIPYIYRNSTFTSGGAGGNASGLSEENVHDHGLADINFGAAYRVKRESINIPDIVINARVKAPTGRHPFGVSLVEVPNSQGNLKVPTSLSTGSGVWSGSVGVSMLKTLDPMVVFGSMTIFHNFKSSFKDIDELPGDQPGRADLGDALQYGAGVAFALNERSSLSLSFTQRWVRPSYLARKGQPWFKVIGSDANVALLNLGATFALTEKMSLLSSLSVGMTNDSPDMVLSARIPFKF